jgi:hypothetical protein
MALKFTIFRTLQNLPKLGFFKIYHLATMLWTGMKRISLRAFNQGTYIHTFVSTASSFSSCKDRPLPKTRRAESGEAGPIRGALTVGPELN